MCNGTCEKLGTRWIFSWIWANIETKCTGQSEWDTRLKSGVNQSLYRARQALRVPGVWNSHNSSQSAHKGSKVVSPTHQLPSPPREYFWYSFQLEAESTPGAIVRPEGISRWKIPVTLSGIKPTTYHLVAQCLNQLYHCVPQQDWNNEYWHSKCYWTEGLLNIVGCRKTFYFLNFKWHTFAYANACKKYP